MDSVEMRQDWMKREGQKAKRTRVSAPRTSVKYSRRLLFWFYQAR
jgi:hypothetical protein